MEEENVSCGSLDNLNPIQETSNKVPQEELKAYKRLIPPNNNSVGNLHA